MAKPPDLQQAAIAELFARHPYMVAYAMLTDMRAAHDPKMAAGPQWEEIGRLQLDFLVAQGLRPEHRFLDIGCSSLRGGRHFIRYLGSGNYTGFDMSEGAIVAAHALVRDEGLEHKRPDLFWNRHGEMPFEMLHARGQRFDYILAHSVFTHLPAELIDACLANVAKVMEPATSRFYFTYDDPADFPHGGTVTMFVYPREVFERLAERHGFVLTHYPEYNHPRGQTMLGVVAR